MVRGNGGGYNQNHNAALSLFGGGGSRMKALPGGGQVAIHQGNHTTHIAAGKGHHKELLTAKVRVVHQRPRLVFSAAVDVSGSMSSFDINTCIDVLLGDSGLAKTLLQKGDYFGCVTFAEGVQRLHHPMPIQKIGLSQDIKNINKCHEGPNTGGTAIYDAIEVGIQDLRESFNLLNSSNRDDTNSSQELVLEHLILTDGSDNHSSSSFSHIQSLVRCPPVPNYHLVIIGIGMCSNDEKRFQDLCRPSHCLYVSASDISALRQEIAQYKSGVEYRIELKLQVQDNGYECSQTRWEGRAEEAPSAAANMVGNSGAYMLANEMMGMLSLNY